MNNHLILSCHESDYETMAALLAGMETHSDFVTADMNELWRREKTLNVSSDTPIDSVVDSSGSIEAAMGPKPKRDAWHGFLFDGFPYATLVSLLESAPWKHVESLRFICLHEFVSLFTLSQFSQAFRGGFSVDKMAYYGLSA